MALSVASLESDLLVLVGPYLRVCDLDHETEDGNNPSLRIPIRRAARAMGVAVADNAVTDEELSGVTGDDRETLLELAEYWTLLVCWGNWPEYDQQAGEEQQSLSQLATRIEKRAEQLKERLGSLVYTPEEVTAATGAMATGLIREGLHIPKVPISPYARQTFWHGGRFYP